MAKQNHGYRSLKLRYGTSPKNGLGRRWFPLEMAWYFVCACELSVSEVVWTENVGTLDPSITLLGLYIEIFKMFESHAKHISQPKKTTQKTSELVNPHWLQGRLQYPWPWIWGLKKHNGFLVAADINEWSFDEWTKFEGIFGSFWNYGRFFWVSMLLYFGPLLLR